MELSSASVSAPHMLIRPNAVHRPMMTSGFGTRPAIVGGFRKMPLPIVMPTISAVPPQNPMTRFRSLELMWDSRVIVAGLEYIRPQNRDLNLQPAESCH